MNIYLDVLSRWLHILSAVALVGGSVFARFAYAPALAALGDEARASFAEAVRSRWVKFVMAGSGFLLLSGLYNAARMAIQYELTTLYNSLLLVKILLALAVFYLAAVLHGRSDSARRFQANRMKWLNINLVLAVTLICIAGVMKLLPREEKVRDETRLRPPLQPSTAFHSPATLLARDLKGKQGPWIRKPKSDWK